MKKIAFAAACLFSFLSCRAGKEPAPPASEPAAQKLCREHTECPSGVCSRFKADQGSCAPERCNFGERADNNNFFCNEKGRWEKSRAEGEPCQKDFMCYQETCFMNPNCELGGKRLARCRAGRCALEAAEDACAAAGKKKVLAPEEFIVTEEQGCVQSMAQRLLRTVCVPCGNGKCDPEESFCNCPEDCAAPKR